MTNTYVGEVIKNNNHRYVTISNRWKDLDVGDYVSIRKIKDDTTN